MVPEEERFHAFRPFHAAVTPVASPLVVILCVQKRSDDTHKTPYHKPHHTHHTSSSSHINHRGVGKEESSSYFISVDVLAGWFHKGKQADAGRQRQAEAGRGRQAGGQAYPPRVADLDQFIPVLSVGV